MTFRSSFRKSLQLKPAHDIAHAAPTMGCATTQITGSKKKTALVTSLENFGANGILSVVLSLKLNAYTGSSGGLVWETE